MRWNLDPSHSSIDFSVRHMGFATVRGRFDDFTVDIASDDDNQLTALDATIVAASINTGEKGRDDHLRSADFLNVEKYPEIRFHGTGFEDRGNGEYRVRGELEIRGTSRPVTFEAHVQDAINDPFGNVRRAAEASGKVNRKEWGLTWNRTLEAGAMLVGEEVRFNLDVQAVRAEAKDQEHAEEAA